MRTVLPTDFNKKSERTQPKHLRELILNISIPFRIFKARYFVSFLIGKNTDTFREEGNRLLNAVVVFSILAIIILVFTSGIIFFLYLIKSLLGIDVFPGTHVLGG